MDNGAVIDDAAELAVVAAVVVGALWLWNKYNNGNSPAAAPVVTPGAVGGPAGAVAGSVYNAGVAVGTAIDNTPAGQATESGTADVLCFITGNC